MARDKEYATVYKSERVYDREFERVKKGKSDSISMLCHGVLLVEGASR